MEEVTLFNTPLGVLLPPPFAKPALAVLHRTVLLPPSGTPPRAALPAALAPRHCELTAPRALTAAADFSAVSKVNCWLPNPSTSFAGFAADCPSAAVPPDAPSGRFVAAALREGVGKGLGGECSVGLAVVLSPASPHGRISASGFLPLKSQLAVAVLTGLEGSASPGPSPSPSAHAPATTCCGRIPSQPKLAAPTSRRKLQFSLARKPVGGAGSVAGG